MKVLVTGATGFIGQNLLLTLSRAGHEPVVLTRNPEKAVRELCCHAPCYRWDYTQNEIDTEAFKGVDAVVHLAGENIAEGRWTSAKKQRIVESRIKGTSHIVETMCSLDDPPGIFVSASATGYYGDRGDEMLLESSSMGNDFLADTCKKWEEEAQKAEHIVKRVNIVRTGLVLGKQGGVLGRILPIFRLGLGGKLGNGRQWMPWIHEDDLSNLFLHILERINSSGAFNGSAPHPVTNIQFTQSLARQLKKPAFFPVPQLALKIGLGEFGGYLTASSRTLPQHAMDTGFVFRYPTINAALSNLLANHRHRFIREQWIQKPVDEVFEFFSNAHNLERITPPFLQFRIKSISTDVIKEQTEIRYRLKLHGIPMRWISRIEEWNPPDCFVDLQLKGPYKYWHHRHEFVPKNNGTIIRDTVHYELPFEPISYLVAGKMVSRDVNKIFAYRRKIIGEIFGS